MEDKNYYAKYGTVSKEVLKIVRGMENNEEWADEEYEKGTISIEEYSLAQLQIHGENMGGFLGLFKVGIALGHFDKAESYSILKHLAINRNCPAVMTVLGQYFGGVYGDFPEERKKWLTRAAETGESRGQYFLAELYLSENNEEEAIKLLTKSAERGHEKAKELLKDMSESKHTKQKKLIISEE